MHVTILPDHASIDGHTDGQTDGLIQVYMYPPPNFVSGGIKSTYIVRLISKTAILKSCNL